MILPFSKTKRTAIIEGITYELDLKETIENQIYNYSCYEPLTRSVINKYIKPGMTIFDIGANFGCHTLWFAKLVAEYGKVYAFEPMEYAISKLKRNIELNNFNNITLETCALSNIVLKNQPTYFQSSYPINRHPQKPKKEHINFTTLDNYIRTNNITKLDFLKIDTDGYEYKIIQGGLNSISKFKPTMIIEFGKYTLKKYGDSLSNLIKLLDSLSYSFYSISDLKKYSSNESLLNSIQFDKSINVLCRPNISP